MGSGTKIDFKSLIDQPGIMVEEDKDLKKFSTMKLSARGNLITVHNDEALKTFFKFIKEHELEFRVLGWGANQILPEATSDLYLQLKYDLDPEAFTSLKDEYVLPASVSLASLTSHAVKFGIKGWEVITGIPATLGGAIFMNAGTSLGEIKSMVKSVRIMNSDGEVRIVEVTSDSFSYRKNNFLRKNEVIIGATLIHDGQDDSISSTIKEYLKFRNNTQPMNKSTCGCTFKNYKTDEVTLPAGKFIDLLGLKGFSINHMRISPKHANFIENEGDSTLDDVSHLIDTIKDELYLQYGVQFEAEIKYDKR